MKYSNNPLLTKRTATFSPCRKYRYTLRIVWDETLPVMAFIGLNPSTADEYQDDPTIRRCRGFAEREGCGGMLMLNLFAFRATDPKVMQGEDDPVGAENAISLLIQDADGPHVACWGTNGGDRGWYIANFLLGLKSFGRNKDGSPKHPLYLRSDAPLQPFGVVIETPDSTEVCR